MYNNFIELWLGFGYSYSENFRKIIYQCLFFKILCIISHDSSSLITIHSICSYS